jgi:glucose-1-phosphate thymidylyltransferase
VKGEYFLTDAFQYMIDQGRKILTAEVGAWYDCGKLETVLETNAALLESGAARRRDFPGVTIHDPVYIEDGVEITGSEIGPAVSIGSGTVIADSVIRNSIIGRDGRLNEVTLEGTMLGDRVHLSGLSGSASLGDDSQVRE